jgi:hypothetical protein
MRVCRSEIQHFTGWRDFFSVLAGFIAKAGLIPKNSRN